MTLEDSQHVFYMENTKLSAGGMKTMLYGTSGTCAVGPCLNPLQNRETHPVAVIEMDEETDDGTDDKTDEWKGRPPKYII